MSAQEAQAAIEAAGGDLEGLATALYGAAMDDGFPPQYITQPSPSTGQSLNAAIVEGPHNVVGDTEV